MIVYEYMLVTIDTGGTKTLIALFDTAGKVVESVKFPTPRQPEDYISELVKTVNKMIEADKITAIGLALPGIIEDGVAIWCTNLGWKNIPVLKLLEKHYSFPIFVNNDANLAGLAETRMRDIKYKRSIYITVSTGIGMGLIVDGHIHPSLTNTEAGHMVIEYEGQLREWETFASGKSIVSTYDKFARDIHDPKIWRQIADKISRGLLTIIPTLSPEIIIFGGSVGTYFDRYGEALIKSTREYLNENLAMPKIEQAIHPEEAVIYGCYYYALDNLQA